jgi:hypothetical protein
LHIREYTSGPPTSPSSSRIYLTAGRSPRPVTVHSATVCAVFLTKSPPIHSQSAYYRPVTASCKGNFFLMVLTYLPIMHLVPNKIPRFYKRQRIYAVFSV